MNRLISWSRPFWLLVAFVPACGGGDDGNGASLSELASTCKQTCSKEKECLGAEASVLDCDKMCSPDNLQKNSKGGSTQSCDYAKLRSKFEDCLSVECKDLEACLEDASNVCKQTPSTGSTVPSTTSTGGTKAGVPTSGAGSASGIPSSGTGSDTTGVPPSGSDAAGSDVPPSDGKSSTPSDDCSVCERANACCLALLGSASGASASSCDTLSKASCESTPDVGRSEFVQICTQTLQGGAAAGIDACK